MKVEHEDGLLQRLETDPHFANGEDPHTVRSFRMRLVMLRSAINMQTLGALRMLDLQVGIHGTYSVRLTANKRLSFRQEPNHTEEMVRVLSIDTVR